MKTLPGSIVKRDILHGAKKADAATFLANAEGYLKAGQITDAIDFFSKAGSHEKLTEVAKVLIEEGDAFSLLKIMHLQSGLISESDIELCAENAEKNGKIRYAILAYEKIENEEKIEKLKESIAEDGDMVAEREAETFVAANLEEIADEEEYE